MLRADEHRIRHIVDAARQGIEFAQGRQREDLESDAMFSFAVIRCIEIIGEAAANLTTATKTELSGVPWRQVVGMRNRLVHGYFDVDLDLVWNTIALDLPVLLSELEPLIADWPPAPKAAE